jgi:MFS family permease
MLTVGLVLLVQRQTGSFGIAGLVDGAFALGLGVGAPVLGRAIDRIGQVRVLLLAALLSATAIVLLVVLARMDAPRGALVALGVVAGASMPPLSSSMRALWPQLAERAGVPVSSAFAFESVMVEGFFILGPLVAGGLVAVASPTVAVLTAAACSLAGSVVFATSATSRGWAPSVSGSGSRLGPLRSTAVLILLFVSLPAGLAFGILSLALPSFAVDAGAPGATGVLWAVQAIGSAVGGLWAGARVWRLPVERRYAIFATAFAAGLAPLALADNLVTLGALIALSGLALAPVTAVGYELIDRAAPPGTSTETFSWVITANVGGAALGSALGGGIVQNHGADAGFLVAMGAALVAAAIAWAGQRTLARGSAT